MQKDRSRLPESELAPKPNHGEFPPVMMKGSCRELTPAADSRDCTGTLTTE